MLAAAVAKTLDARFDRAQSVGLVRVRLERVADDVRLVQLDADAVRRAPERGAVGHVVESERHTVHASDDGTRARL